MKPPEDARVYLRFFDAMDGLLNDVNEQTYEGAEHGRLAALAYLEAHIDWARNLTPSPKSWRSMTLDEQKQWREEHP